MEFLDMLLLGVGDEQHEWIQMGEIAIHKRRRLTPAECRMLPSSLPVFTNGCAAEYAKAVTE